MGTVVIAMLVKPFVALFVFGCICLPARIAVQKLPDSRFKRLLLTPVRKDRLRSASGK